jgi:hypothetical protein
MNAKVYDLHVPRVQNCRFVRIFAYHLGLIRIDMIEFQYTFVVRSTNRRIAADSRILYDQDFEYMLTERRFPRMYLMAALPCNNGAIYVKCGNTEICSILR